MPKQLLPYLQDTARQLRLDAISAVYFGGDGHLGPSMSAADIVTTLYFHEMTIDAKNPQKPDRDRFILSKGHACPILYAALAHAGYFDKEELKGLRTLDSMLQGHPDMVKTPGVDSTSGSLGNGLSVGLGMALTAKKRNESWRTYVMLGDGELGEGVVWEAVLAAGHHKTNNLVAIVDNNGYQSGGYVKDVSGAEPVAEKFAAFDWHTITINGHSHQEILDAFAEARSVTDKPTAIIAKTIKGYGVSYMKGNNAWHKKQPTQEEYEIAVQELGDTL